MKKLVSRTGLLTSTITDELRAISRSAPIVLVILGGVVGYGVLYNLLYRPNVVEQVAVVVVDDSQSATSRRLTTLIGASPKVEIVGHLPDLSEARRAMADQSAEGIIYIPADLVGRLGRGESAVFVLLASTAQFLNYEAIAGGALGAMEWLDGELRPEMVRFIPADKIERLLQTQTFEVVGTPLHNPTRGYADYLMPAVLVAILFQTMMMAIAIRTGELRSRGTIIHYARRGISWSSVAIVVVARAFVYVIIYAVLALFLVGLLPIVFDLPRCGAWLDVVVLLVPFLISTALLGQAFGLLFRDSDAGLLLITFFSVGLLFLSGMSFPLELLPQPWHSLHYILPAPTAILGEIKVGSMGATASDIAPEILTLWAEAVGYFIVATAMLRHTLKRAIGRPLPPEAGK